MSNKLNGYDRVSYKITVDHDLCIGCCACTDIPCLVTGEYLFYLKDGVVYVNESACRMTNKADAICFSKLCPTGAIIVENKKLDIEDYYARFR